MIVMSGSFDDVLYVGPFSARITQVDESGESGPPKAKPSPKPNPFKKKKGLINDPS